MQKNVFDAVTPEARKMMELANPGFPGWEVVVDGLVAKPLKVDVRQLLSMMHIG
jgi:DMSO/TMAO reductase YedYZ molybdopterin-dependent catalytic subunit